MKRLAVVFWVLAYSGLASPGPEQVARDYFDAAIAGDTDTVQSLVLPDCLDTKIGRGADRIAGSLWLQRVDGRWWVDCPLALP